MLFKLINKFLKQERAFSTLETALVVPAIMLLLFGALDVSRILQAYSAVEEGVNNSLRCIYPTDSNCSSPEIQDWVPRYNYYSTETTTQWLRSRVRYKADVSWINRPRTTFSEFSPTVIGEFNYTLPPKGYLIERIKNVGSVNFHHNIMQANSPYIINQTTSSQNANATQNLKFVFPNQTKKDYPSTIMKSSAELRLSNSLTSTEYILEDIKAPKVDRANIPCYRGKDFNKFIKEDQREASYSSSCYTNWAPFSFYIEGVQKSRAGGRVLIFAKNIIDADTLNQIKNGENPDTNKWISLGGQTFLENTSNSNRIANFAPRGARDWSGNFNNNYPEYKKYKRLFAKANSKIKIKFVLERAKGVADTKEVSWQLKRLSTFSPIISYYKSKSSIECEYENNKKDCLVNYPNTNILIPNNGKIEFKPLGIKPELRELPCEKSHLTENEAYKTVGWDGCLSCSKIENPDIKVCLPFRDTLGEAKKIECIENCNFSESEKTCLTPPSLSSLNFGVTGNPNELKSASQNEALKICGVNESDLKGFTISEVAGSFKEYIITYLDESFSYLRETCEQESLPAKNSIPKIFSNFRKSSWLKSSRENVKFETENKDPDELLKTDLYKCFSKGSKIFDSELEKDYPKKSLFMKEEFEICDCEELKAKEVKSDSVYKKEFLDAKLFVDLQCIKTTPLLVVSNKGDLCPAPIPQVTQLDEWKEVLGGPFIEGVTPDICSQSGISCSSEFYDFVSTGKANSDLNQYESRAINLAHNSVNQIAPWINTRCSSKTKANCAEFLVEQTDTRVNLTGEIRVPLTILGNYTLPIKVSRSRVLEKSF